MVIDIEYNLYDYKQLVREIMDELERLGYPRYCLPEMLGRCDSYFREGKIQEKNPVRAVDAVKILAIYKVLFKKEPVYGRCNERLEVGKRERVKPTGPKPPKPDRTITQSDTGRLSVERRNGYTITTHKLT